jgi:hypothetical protein
MGAVAAAGLLVLFAGCGDGGPVQAGQSAVTAATDTVSSVVDPMVDYVSTLVAMSRVDQRRAVDTLCATWQSSKGDNQAVNDYVEDLLQADRSSPGIAAPSHEQVSKAVTTACATSRTDPGRFVKTIAGELKMSADDLKARVVAACVRYRTRVARDKASGYSINKDLDPFIRGIAAQAGVDDAALRSAVDAICPS